MRKSLVGLLVACGAAAGSPGAQAAPVAGAVPVPHWIAQRAQPAPQHGDRRDHARPLHRVHGPRYGYGYYVPQYGYGPGFYTPKLYAPRYGYGPGYGYVPKSGYGYGYVPKPGHGYAPGYGPGIGHGYYGRPFF